MPGTRAHHRIVTALETIAVLRPLTRRQDSRSAANFDGTASHCRCEALDSGDFLTWLYSTQLNLHLHLPPHAPSTTHPNPAHPSSQQ
jgi:hypothetical protein